MKDQIKKLDIFISIYFDDDTIVVSLQNYYDLYFCSLKFMCEHSQLKYLQDLRSACRDRLRSRGVVLDEGPCVAVFTRESSRASSPSPIISAIASSPRLRALPANESKVNHPAFTESLKKCRLVYKC